MRIESFLEPNAELDESERHMKQQLVRLQQEYAEMAAPYLRRLADLEALRPRRCVMLFEVDEEIPQHMKELNK